MGRVSVAGIDYSTRAVDVVLLDEDTDAAAWHRVDLEGADAFDRARDVKFKLRRLGTLTDFFEETIAVGIEDPRGYGAGSLYRVQGAILACIPPTLLVQPWIPSAWRKAVGLPGNASKDAVRSFVLAPDGVWKFRAMNAWPQDACDAYCIALATRNKLERKQAA